MSHRSGLARVSILGVERYTRSMNTNLAEGMSDGKYRKVVADRGGLVEGGTYAARRDLDDIYHGIHEVGTKVLGDGTQHTTPDYVETPAARLI